VKPPNRDKAKEYVSRDRTWRPPFTFGTSEANDRSYKSQTKLYATAIVSILIVVNRSV
jgi:hypothetical protein